MSDCELRLFDNFTDIVFRLPAVPASAASVRKGSASQQLKH